MRPRTLTSILVFFAAAVISSGGAMNASAHADAPRSAVIKITADGFLPSSVEVAVGGTVTFENADTNDSHWPASNVHPTHGIYPEFDPGRGIPPGQSWSFTFDKPGNWRMHDHLFPQLSGVVIVEGEEAAAAPEEEPGFWKSVWNGITWPVRATVGWWQDLRLSKNTTGLHRDEQLLKAYVQKFGVRQTIGRLDELGAEEGFDCHQAAHQAGRLGYDHFRNTVFSECPAECHSGCYHGATEEFFFQNGTNDFIENFTAICAAAKDNDFFQHQCWHGIGHGIMAWTNYEIYEALAACDEIERPRGRESCYSGVFMENVMGMFVDKQAAAAAGAPDTHFTKYLSDDPQYPCNAVEEKYKNSCYFFQTSRMNALWNWDFSRTAAECEKVPALYQDSCYISLGRDIDGTHFLNPLGSISGCMVAKPGCPREQCLTGAEMDIFWDKESMVRARTLCENVYAEGERNACYAIFIRQIVTLYDEPAGREEVCRSIKTEKHRTQRLDAVRPAEKAL